LQKPAVVLSSPHPNPLPEGEGAGAARAPRGEGARYPSKRRRFRSSGFPVWRLRVVDPGVVDVVAGSGVAVEDAEVGERGPGEVEAAGLTGTRDAVLLLGEVALELLHQRHLLLEVRLGLGLFDQAVHLGVAGTVAPAVD